MLEIRSAERGYLSHAEILRKTASPRKTTLKSGSRLMNYGQKRFSIWRPCAILNSKSFHIWSRDCLQVPNVRLCTKFYQTWVILTARRVFIALTMQSQDVSLYVTRRY